MKDQKLKDMLSEGVVVVTFEKKDGTVREMQCSLHPDFVPVQPVVESADGPAKQRKAVDTEIVQPVYDLKSNGWRSFRWDSVKSYTQITLGE